LETLFIINAVLVWFVLLFNLLLTLVIIRRANATNQVKEEERLEEGISVGIAASDFQAELLDGASLSLASVAGQPLLLLFISTGCKPCRELLTRLTTASLQTNRTLLIVSRDDADQTRELVREFQIPFPVAVAPEDTTTFFKDYNISLTPSYCLVDEKGLVQSSGVASANLNKWKSAIKPWMTPQAAGIGA
jgi:peroxiredoxin